MNSLPRDSVVLPSASSWTPAAVMDLRWLPLALLAAALPMLFAPSASPTSTFANQWISFAGSAAWLLVWALHAWSNTVDVLRPRWASGAGLLVVVLLTLAVAYLLPGAPIGDRLVTVAALLLAAALAWASACAARSGDESSFAEPLMMALAVAGLLSVVIALVQVFAPSWAHGDWIAYPTTPGRAVGNMRQPNQLSTLFMWALAAVVWLAASRSEFKGGVVTLASGAMTLLVIGVVLTASRTGTLGVLLLAIWGLVDTRLPRTLRVMMVFAVVQYALGWWVMEHWTTADGEAFYGEDQIRKTLHGDASSSRGKIWANTLSMIAASPWTGTGPGAFNFVWTMTPFPNRPVAFFDHCHNLFLQWAVEFGVPLALAFSAVLAMALVRGVRALVQADEARARSARAAWFMLTVVGVHSMLEYPLWYVYFLLPTGLIAGWALGLTPDRGGQGAEVASRRSLQLVGMLSCVALVGSASALWQYYQVALIFEPGLSIGAPGTLPDRIRHGRTSVLFGHHADYAEVTVHPKPELEFAAFERPLYHLLDTRLMIAYAKALAARGEDQRARHVAARLREFRNPASDAFFKPCAATGAGNDAPFQCRTDPGLNAVVMWPGGP